MQPHLPNSAQLKYVLGQIMRVFADLIRTPARKILALVLFAVLVFIVFLVILVHHAEQLLRARVIETLSTRF
jgi:hypothetical protein